MFRTRFLTGLAAAAKAPQTVASMRAAIEYEPLMKEDMLAVTKPRATSLDAFRQLESNMLQDARMRLEDTQCVHQVSELTMNDGARRKARRVRVSDLAANDFFMPAQQVSLMDLEFGAAPKRSTRAVRRDAVQEAIMGDFFVPQQHASVMDAEVAQVARPSKEQVTAAVMGDFMPALETLSMVEAEIDAAAAPSRAAVAEAAMADSFAPRSAGMLDYDAATARPAASHVDAVMNDEMSFATPTPDVLAEPSRRAAPERTVRDAMMDDFFMPAVAGVGDYEAAKAKPRRVGTPATDAMMNDFIM